MNAVGRQSGRPPIGGGVSAVGGGGVHHQRQYSDYSLDSSSSSGSSKWLHQLYSSQLQQQQQQQEYGRMNSNRVQNHPSTPPLGSRQQRDSLSPSELSPGILDLQSFDTDLLPLHQHHRLHHNNNTNDDMPGLASLDNAFPFSHVRGRSFDDSESYLSSTNKQTNRNVGLPETSLSRSFSVEKDKTNPVAKIKVVVRKRPLNRKEISKKEEDIVSIEPNSSCLTVHETKLKVDLTEYEERHEFVFDAVLDEDVSNDDVYRETVEPIVPTIFQRTKATCFAYGQTGSGKTYTMQPLPLKASQDILTTMNYKYRNQGFQLFVSFFEIYGGKLYDLLNERSKLCMREDGKQQVCIVGLQEYRVSSVDSIKELIDRGNATRSTGTTGANEESSRSHAILQLVIKRSVDGSESKPARVIGKLSFIDLAGSERGADTTDNDKQTRIEGAEINKSLLALKECIRALDSDQGHIPFRGSKLTEVLRDSFVGNSRTVMISCISPNSGSCEHTLNTLRYADRVKSLSKGNNSKKEFSTASSNLLESTTSPLSSMLPITSNFGSSLAGTSSEANRFGSSKQIQIEASPSFNMDRVASRRESDSLCNGDVDYFKNHRGKVCLTGEDFDSSEYPYEQEKRPWKPVKPETYTLSTVDDKMKCSDVMMRRRDMSSGVEINGLRTEDDLNVLLQEEEDLVTAHMMQVEETIDIVKEEMKILAEADQPGNHLDKYINKLNSILSQKAVGILNLQARLAHFQRRLNENNVLISSALG
ncbi:Diatom spindle kinesin 1 [Acorus calamus]|uniref:Kinesin-like protein n=1 Tax=Acorus calamus TaxID=4465 RepID=A0AAV9EGB7_ACOCL|nr:Diatom spindle kinesin 1 [Acorus calamus]